MMWSEKYHRTIVKMDSDGKGAILVWIYKQKGNGILIKNWIKVQNDQDKKFIGWISQ